ncbi:restriction endonuclease [Cohnella ginsengisoli]|uniref:Restriction endonuclease n=1 Tax=Cohnella ginsengisoli TaxID=425004 RepID=A0A9X4KHG6_9BACL|nr:restriction endonuclease [Cohnella ginsengisoli]MDG0792248.1 restriction endonuclease [Cohnella ginsengisoli]
MAKRRKRSKKDSTGEMIAGLVFLSAIGMYVWSKSAVAAVITFIFVLGIFIAIKLIIDKQREERLRKSGIYDIDKMDGRQFELYLGSLYKALGYKSEVTRSTGDYGADLVIEKNGVRTVVQAKCYSKNVGIDAVQQVQGSKAHYKAEQALVVTNRGFTEAAKTLAHSNGVNLVDREFLINMILTINPEQKPNTIEVAATTEKTEKPCPRCGKPLILRKGPKGEFYGCSAFPKCRHISEASPQREMRVTK